MPDMDALARQAAARLARREAVYARKVAGVLRKALDDIRVQMSKVYERYATDGVLSTADMARYNRYVSMEANITRQLDPALRSSMATMKRVPPAEYQAGFFNTAWMVDQATELRLNWGIINTKAIRAAFSIDDPTNKAMAEALKRYPMEARRKIRQAITDGLAQGKSYQKMMRQIKDALNKTNYEAMRIIRTEGQTAQNAGAGDAYDRALEDGVRGEVVWSATLDGATRDQHQAMDGQVRDKDGLFHFPNGETAPYPAHEGLSAENRIACRCKARMQVEGYAPQLRRTRDEGVIPYMKYDEWEKAHGPIVH